MISGHDESRRRLEALKVARQLLNDEYIARRSEEYNKWLVDSQVAWQTQGVRLPPPSGSVLYPTEQEIVAKALEYYNFTTTSGQGVDFNNTPPVTPTVIPTKEEIEPKEKHHAESLIKDIPEPPTANEPKFTAIPTASATGNTIPVATAPLPSEKLNETVDRIPTVDSTTSGTPVTGTDSSASNNNPPIQAPSTTHEESELTKAVPPELKPLFANTAASTFKSGIDKSSVQKVASIFANVTPQTTSWLQQLQARHKG
jgi:hypothetical protein